MAFFSGVLDNTVSDLSPFSDENLSIKDATSTQTRTVSLTNLETQSWGFITEANIPNNASWEDGGTWTVEYESITGSHQITGRCRCVRLDSAGNILQSGTFTGTQALNADRTFTLTNPSWTNGEEDSGNRLAIEFEFINNDTMNQSVQFGLNTLNNEVITNISKFILSKTDSDSLFIYGHKLIPNEIFYGIESEFVNSGSVSFNSIAMLDDSRFVIAYKDVADSNHGTAKIGTIVGSDVIFGEETHFLTDTIGLGISVTVLSSSGFVVSYEDSTDSKHGTSKVGIVDGTNITFGPETEFSSTTANVEIANEALTSSGFIVAWRDVDDAGKGTAKFGTVDGTDISFGIESEFSASGLTDDISVAPLSSSGFVVAYRDSGDDSNGSSKIGTVDGTTISFGPEFEFNVEGAQNISVASFSPSGFVVVYEDDFNDAHGFAQVGTVSGTTITYGPVSEFYRFDGVSSVDIAFFDESTFVVVYRDTNTAPKGAAIIGTIDGTNITFALETDFHPGDFPVYNSVTVADPSTFVVAYRDRNDSDHGTVKVGKLPPFPTIVNLFIDGHILDTNSSTLFIAGAATGVDSINDSFDLFIHGLDQIQTSGDLFLEGSILTSGEIDLFINGFNIISGVSDLFINGHKSLSTSGDMFIEGSILTSGEVDLFINSFDITSGVTDLFINGHKFFLSQEDVREGLQFGSESVFDSSGIASWTSVARIDPSTFVVAFRDEGDSNHGTAKVGKITGTDVTFGTETEFFSPGNSLYNSVIPLTASTFIVLYRSNADANGKARIGTIDGTNITFSPESEFLSSGNINSIFAASLSESTIVVTYSDSDDSTHGIAKIGTVSGDTMVFGSGTKFHDTSAMSHNSVAKLSESGFVVVFNTSPLLDFAGSGEARIGTISGTTITFGSGVTYSDGGNNNAVTSFDQSKFVVAYRDSSNSFHGAARVGNVSGDNISFDVESEFVIESGVTDVALATLNPSTFVVAYTDESNFSHGTAKIGTIDSPITFGPAQEYLGPGIALYNALAFMEKGVFVVAFSDILGDDASVKVGTIPLSCVDLFLSTHDVASTSGDLFIHGFDIASGVIDLFIEGSILVSGDVDLFIDSFDIASGTSDLFINGHKSLSTSGDLFIHGHANASTSGDMFIEGHDNVSVSGDLFIHGFAQESGTQPPLFTEGHDTITDSVDLFMSGSGVVASITGSIDLYTLGLDNITTSGDLFINGHKSVSTSGDLFTLGLDNITSSTNLFTEGFVESSGATEN